MSFTDSPKLFVGLPNDLLAPAALLSIDHKRDLALLKTDATETLVPLVVQPSLPAFGDNVTALLVGLDAAFSVRVGTVLGLEIRPVSSDASTGRILVDLPVEPGSSGTPVVDKECHLVGIVQASDRDHRTFLIPASEALSFVTSYQRTPRTQSDKKSEQSVNDLSASSGYLPSPSLPPNI